MMKDNEKDCTCHNPKGFYAPLCPEAYGLVSAEQQKKDNKALNDAINAEYPCK